MLKNAIQLAAVALAGILVASCSDKGPADTALKAADQAVSSVQGEAAKFAPDQFKSLSDSLAAAKDSFQKGDYTAALNAAQAIPAKATAVAQAARARKGELTKSWADLSATVPSLVEQIRGKLDSLAKMKKLPKGMDKAKVEEARTAFEGASKTWGDASDAFKAGNLADAVAKANDVKARAGDIAKGLGMEAASAAPAAAR